MLSKGDGTPTLAENLEMINTELFNPENETDKNFKALMHDKDDGSEKITFSSNDIAPKENFQKRSVSRFSADSGYGSRLAAGSRLAQGQLAWHNIFGRGGPGKRSFTGYMTLSAHGAAPQGGDKPVSMSVFKDGNSDRVGAENMMGSESVMSDNGYKIPYHELGLGMGGLRQYNKNGGLGVTVGESNSENDEFDGGEDAIRFPQKRRYGTDNGYGSRIAAGNRLADVSAVNYVFGRNGPGKR